MYLSIYLSIGRSIDLSIYLSVYLYLYLYLSIYLFIYLSIYRSIYYLSFYIFVFNFLCIFISISISLSLYLSISLCLYLSISLSLYLSIYLPIYLSTYLPIYLSTYLPIYLSTYLPIYLSTYLSIYLLPIYLSTYLPIYLSTYLPIYLSIYLSICKIKNEEILRDVFRAELDNIRNEAIVRDFLIFRSSRHQKRKNSARLPSEMESWVQSWQPRTNAFCDCASPPGKVLRLPRKIGARSYEVLHLSRKIILANLHIWYSKMQPLSGNQRPDLLTSLMNMSFVLRLPRKMHLCRSSLNVPCLPSFLEILQNPHVLFTFEEVHNPLRLPRETASEPPKVVRTPSVLYILTWKCASRHNGVHFFDISTSKSGPNVVCFVHFDFEMCFAPQRRALFRHLNFQKWFDTEVFCTFWLRNVLRTTTACAFSTSQLPKVLRDPCFLYLFTWKCASRHNGVQFFISHLASWLRIPPL